MKTIEAISCSGIVIAFSSSASVALFSLVLYGSVQPILLSIVFMITMGVYIMDRVLGVEKDRTDHPERCDFVCNNRCGLILACIILTTMAVALGFMQSFVFGVLTMFAPLIVYLYSRESKGREISIKKIPYVKGMVIAAGWTALVLVACIYNNSAFGVAAFLFSIGVFGKYYVMAVLYDFKDMSSDKANGVPTLPNMFGEKNTKVYLHIINTLSTVWVSALSYTGILPKIGYVFIPAFFYQAMLIRTVSKDAPNWVYYTLCDLEQVVWLFLALVAIVWW